MRYTFEPYRPDGSPRKMHGLFRSPLGETLKEHSVDGSGYVPTYEQYAVEQAWIEGKYDRPLYELEDGEDDA